VIIYLIIVTGSLFELEIYNLVILASGIIGVYVGKNFKRITKSKLVIPLLISSFCTLFTFKFFSFQYWFLDIPAAVSLGLFVYKRDIGKRNLIPAFFGRYTLEVYILQIIIFKILLRLFPSLTTTN